MVQNRAKRGGYGPCWNRLISWLLEVDRMRVADNDPYVESRGQHVLSPSKSEPTSTSCHIGEDPSVDDSALS
jgi:hypothetical protein